MELNDCACATEVDNETKRFLQDTGYWDEYRADRAMRVASGVEAQQAVRDSVARFVPLAQEYAYEHKIPVRDIKPKFTGATIDLMRKSGVGKVIEITKAPAADRASEGGGAEPGTVSPAPDFMASLGKALEQGTPGDGGGPIRRKGDKYSVVRLKRGSAVEVIEWVSRHLLDKLTQEQIDSAPGMDAIGMHESYSRLPIRRDEFWSQVYTKLVPNKAQLSTVQKIELDGKRVLDNIDRIMGVTVEEFESATRVEV